jgi:hypothetical protein
LSDLIRPRSVTEIVDAAFQIYRRCPTEFMVATGMIYVPYLIVRLIVLGGGTLTEQNIGSMIPLFLGMMVVYSLMDAPAIALASDVYLGKPGNALAVLRRVIPRLPAVAAASALRFVLLVVSAFFLLVPSVYFTAVTFAVTQVIVIEGTGTSASFSRSSALSRELKWHILSTGFLALVIWLVLSLGVALSIAWVDSNIVKEVVQALLIVVAYPIVAITKTVLYYDTRIRREGFDIEWLATQGPGPAALDGAVA